ncbi:ABC transporter ATP-binding protein [Corynebacterium flavescens]
MGMIEIRNATFSYPGQAPILRGINVTLEGGHLVAVLGPNGVGKTTFLRCMLGLIPWSSGCTLLDDRDIKSINPRELWRDIAYVPQARNSGSLSLSGIDMVMIGRSAHLRTFSQPGKEDRAVAERVMEQLGIEGLRDVACGHMSGGQFQMILIARALAANPRMLVLDEPETGLDFRNQLIVLGVLEQLAYEQGLLVVMNTHYPAHALRVADYSMILRSQQPPVFGLRAEVLTPEILGAAFDVKLHIADVEVGGRSYPAVVPMDVREEASPEQF